MRAASPGRGWWVARTVLAGGAVAAGSGALAQAIATARDARRFPPPGRLVDVGGHRLHLVCQGVGRPAVILEAGLSSCSLDWRPVQSAIARVTQVCAYDRAGAGWSDPGPRPRTGGRIVAELRALLHRAGIPAPYVLVGQSYGGQLSRLYASRYPDEVAGLVLLDSSHEDQAARFRPTRPVERLRGDLAWRLFRLRPIWARLGLLRLLDKPNQPYVVARLPPADRAGARARGLHPAAYDWVWGDAAAIPATDAQCRAADPLPPVPLAVLTAADSPAAWLELQADLAGRSPRSRHRIAERGGHMLHIDRPDLVSEAIRWAIDTARR